MLDDDWDGLSADELQEQHERLGFAIREAELALSRASTRLYDQLTADGTFSQEQVARRYGVRRSTVSKLQNRDGDPDWKMHSVEMYRRLEGSAGNEPVCARLREGVADLRARRGRLARVIRDRTLSADVAQESFDAHSEDLIAYLDNLSQALSWTLPWQPGDSFSSVFTDRRVRLVQSPQLPAVPDGRVHMPTRQVVEGDVDWDEAAPALRRLVVLGDAGYGKTWLLRRHAQDLCQRALASVRDGLRLEEIEVPAWLHAADLARSWQMERHPLRALLAAAGRTPMRSGFVCSRDLDRFLADAFAHGRLCVHVDGFDEVYPDADREALADALRWLGDQVRHGSGPRVILASRPAGFASPFQEGGSWPETCYLFLGALSPREVGVFWRAWYVAKGLPYPSGRLESVLAAGSPMRDYARVPLIAAFCAWVAESDQVRDTVAGLFAQVVDRFVQQSWKAGSPAPAGSVTRGDPVRWRQIRRSLEQLAWFMATGSEHWQDVAEPSQAENQLAGSGFESLPGWTRVGELVRILGVLVPLTGAPDGHLLWVHPSLHQFLVARRLVGLEEEEIARWALRGQLRPEWAEVLRFAVELEADDEPT